MDISLMNLDAPLFSSLRHLLNATDDNSSTAGGGPTRTYVRDARAMAATPADVKEYPNSYVFIVDMPGLKSGDIKVQVEDDNVLVISGERKREHDREEKEGVKYVRMERRIGKFMRKFALPENANTDAISAVCQDGVLTVTVEKLPPPEPKKPKTIEVRSTEEGFRSSWHVPPDLILNGNYLHYGQWVDVFHEDAWWEGVIFDHGDGSDERSVFFPDIGDELKVPFKNHRFTQDWDAATDQWSLRGGWIFLEVIEELELEWPIFVSLKQIWYEVRINKCFVKEMLDWTCPLRDIWKETVKEVIMDNLKFTMAEFFSRLNSSGDLQLESELKECFLDYMVNLEPSFFEPLGAVVPCDPNPLQAEEEFDDDCDLGPPITL